MEPKYWVAKDPKPTSPAGVLFTLRKHMPDRVFRYRWLSCPDLNAEDDLDQDWEYDFLIEEQLKKGGLFSKSVWKRINITATLAQINEAS